MAAPILKIPVDDEAFRKFLAAFQKYQKSVGEQSDVWHDVNDTIKDLAHTGASFVDSIEDQIAATQKLIEHEDKRDRLLRDAAARRKKEQEDEKKRQDEADRKRKQSVQSIRDYGRTLSDVVTSLGKIGASSTSALGLVSGAGEGLGAAAGALGGGGGMLGGLGGAAAVGAGALAVVGAAGYASYELADRNADLYRRASGIGINTGQLQGASLFQNRLFDTESAMDRIMRMKYDVTQRGPLYAMGVRPEGKDPSQILTELSLRAKSMIDKNPESFLTNAHAYGYDKIFSAEDLMRIKGSSREELIKYGKNASDFAKLHGNTEAQNKTLTEFKNNVDATSTAFTNDLIPATVKVAEAFNSLVDKVDAAGGPGGVDSLTSQAAAQAASSTFGAGSIFAGPLGVLGTFGYSMFKGIKSSLFGGEETKINQTEELKKAAKAFPDLEKKYGLPSGMLSKIAQIESGGGRNAGYSRKGALGAFQFMPDAAARYGVTNRSDVNQEAVGAAKYLHDLMVMFHGDETAAVAAYNAGEGAIQRRMKIYGSSWLGHTVPETFNYVGKYRSIKTPNPTVPNPSDYHKSWIDSWIYNDPGQRSTVVGNSGSGSGGNSGRPLKVSLNINNSTGNSVAINANSAKTAALA